MSNITIRKKLDSIDLIRRAFELIGCVNKIPITKGESELLGYIVNFGFPKTREQKQAYFDLYKRSEPTLNNLVHTLKKKGFLLKKDGEIIIHPALKLNKRETLNLNIVIEYDSQ